MVQSAMETLLTGDGLKLRLRRWPTPPEAGPSRGTVQIVHGLGEHMGRYEGLAAALNAAGWRVVGHDLRGHGLSEGPRGAIAGEQTMLADLGAVTEHLRNTGKGPHVLLGHSLGGLIAARFVAESLMNSASRWSQDVDGLVLSSPALDAGLGPLRRALVGLLAVVLPGLPLPNGLRASWISRDPAVVRRYREDPLVHGSVTPQLVQFIVNAGDLVLRRAARWRTPTLLMWAGADRCVAPAGSATFARLAPGAVVTAREYPPLFHEIFNEPERQAVIEQLTTWLQRF
jgi:alpha-beta hydrolase superfamily lysophospholipase